MLPGGRGRANERRRKRRKKKARIARFIAVRPDQPTELWPWQNRLCCQSPLLRVPAPSLTIDLAPAGEGVIYPAPFFFSITPVINGIIKKFSVDTYITAL